MSSWSDKTCSTHASIPENVLMIWHNLQYTWLNPRNFLMIWQNLHYTCPNPQNFLMIWQNLQYTCPNPWNFLMIWQNLQLTTRVISLREGTFLNWEPGRKELGVDERPGAGQDLRDDSIPVSWGTSSVWLTACTSTSSTQLSTYFPKVDTVHFKT